MTRQTFLKTLGIELPIIQAPMAGVSSPAMAAAVANAGALGSIGVGATNAKGAGEMIAAVRQGTSHAFNVNVFCHAPAVADADRDSAWLDRLRPTFDRFGAAPPAHIGEIYKSFVSDDEMLALLVAERPKVVSFHFGLPSASRIAALRDAGIVLLGSATNLGEARILAAAGMDAIVAQGWEAGGHRGVFDIAAADEMLATHDLTRNILREVGVPVIASGGIMDGPDIAAVLSLGASAAQLGTAFVACDESLADAGYRRALTALGPKPTIMTRVISGRPARCLVNAFTELGSGITAADIPNYPIAYDAGKSLNAAAKAAGHDGYGAQWAGTGAARTRPMAAAALVAKLAQELRQAELASA